MRLERYFIGLGAVFGWGLVLRVMYYLGTPFYARGYDTNGHMEYILYMMENLRVPKMMQMWESHQQPLYYFLLGSLARLERALGRSLEGLPHDIAFVSLLMSMTCLAAIVWVVFILFPRDEQRHSAWLAALVPATLPGIVYFATRISNDSLLLLVMTVWLAFFLRWWRDGKQDDWLFCVLMLVVGLATKMNALPLVAPMGLCLLARRGTPMRIKIRWGVIFALALLLTAAWHVWLRPIGDIAGFLETGTRGGVNRRLYALTRPINFVQFNPFIVMQAPFVTPWDSLSHRDIFFEYLFQSAFFGEWRYPRMLWLARAILGLGSLGLVAAVAGLWRAARAKEGWGWPVVSTALILVASLIVYRVKFPCACNQDFRFIPLLGVIAGPAIVWGISWLRQGLARNIAYAGIVLFCGLQGVFLFSFRWVPSWLLGW